MPPTEEGTADVTAWYEQLRQQYRPDRLEILLIGESPPDPGAGGRRFFYAPTLQIDNLYRGVAQGLYGNHPEVDLMDKAAVLGRLQADGFWLIDAVDRPVNHLPPGPRRAAITAAVPSLSPAALALPRAAGSSSATEWSTSWSAPVCMRAASRSCMTSRCRSP
jgi:hypothetical protein